MKRRNLTILVLAFSLTAVWMLGPTARAQEVSEPTPGPDIVGGGEAMDREYPFMVAMISSADINPPFNISCGGTLVREDWVLTAKHCVDGGTSPASIDMIVRAWDLGSASSGVRFDAIDIILHPTSDTALVQIDGSATSDQIALATPADSGLYPSGVDSTVIGWGSTQNTPPGTPLFPDKLREVAIPVVSDDSCDAAWGSGTINFALEICAGGELNLDSCSGDSGGPLIVPDGSGDWLQIGIASAGSFPCGLLGVPGIYAQVDTIESWVTAIAGPPTPIPDATAPTVTLTSPADGAVYPMGSVVVAGYACTDEVGGSGLASCSGTVVPGAAIDTATLGAKTFTVTGTDNAGNTEVVTHSYTVDAVPPTVGLVDPAQGRWHLRDGAGDVTSFVYGDPGDVPFMGDWDCDGDDAPGLYRQSDGFVYLRNRNTQGNADIRFFFGDPGDLPLAGDFNGDGCDTVSIYRPSEARVFVINELGANDGGLGAADFDYVFGNLGDKPFVGDFDGDGIETVGLHRESTGLVYFRNSHTQGNADAQFIFGDPGDRLVSGDWGIVDGVDTPVSFRPSDTTFYFRYTNTQGNADGSFVFGETDWLPVAGAFGLG